jgi:hypothetical protein
MAVTKNKPGFAHGATSKLASQKFITKPENRVGAAPHPKSVGQAEKLVAKLGSGK